MDKIIVGAPGDDNYVQIGTLSNGLPVYRYVPPLPRIIDEKVIDAYNESTELVDTETINLLEKFYADEAKEHEKEALRLRVGRHNDNSQPVNAATKSKYTDPILRLQTDAMMYLEGIQKLEKKEKKKPTVKTVEPVPPTPVKRKQTKSVQVEEYSTDTAHYTDHLPKHKEQSKAEPIQEEEEVKPKYSKESLVDSYLTARQKERDVEQQLHEKKIQSIADFYEKLKDGKEPSLPDDKEVLGYLKEPGSVELPVTEDTSEYLDIFTRKDEKEKEDRKTTSEIHVDDSTEPDIDIVEEVEHKDDKVDVDVNEYLPTEDGSLIERKETDKDSITNVYEDVTSPEPVEESLATPIIDYYKEKKDSDSETIRYYDKPTEEVHEVEIDPKEYVEEFDNKHDSSRKVHVDLSREYFQEMYNAVTDDDIEASDILYENSLRDLEQKKIQRESAAHIYLKNIRKLSMEQQKLLAEHERLIAGQKERTRERYEELLVLVNQKTDNIYDEIGNYTFDIDIFERTITVTNDEADASNIFVYEGTLREYNIEDTTLKLYSTQTEDTDIKHDPGIYVTHHYTSYDLQTSQLLKNDSYTLVKLEEATKRAGTRAPAAPGISSTTGGGKPAGDGPHPGIVMFTTGHGYTDSFDGWSDAHSPPSQLSAIAPDGWEKGRVRIGVERKQIGARKATGALTVRYLITNTKPSFAAENDYTIDWDPAQNDNAHDDEAVGSGAYNYAYQSLDSEVAFNSGAGLTYETDPLSGEVQTITWADGELGVKYIDIYHCKLGVTDNKQDGNRWYGVYLTTSQSYIMGMSATPGAKGPGNTRTPSKSAILAPYTSDFSTERGNITSPFFVAVSGWSLGQADSIYG